MGYWTPIQTTRPKARSVYCCELCGLAIQKGERHVKIVGVYDGDFASIREHEKCEAIASKWTNAQWKDMPDPYEFRREFLNEKD
jgi:hypothetical protein